MTYFKVTSTSYLSVQPCETESRPPLLTVKTPSSAVDIMIIELFTRLRDYLQSLPAVCLILEKIAVLFLKKQFG